MPPTKVETHRGCLRSLQLYLTLQVALTRHPVHLQGKTPLWLACDAGRADHVEVLLGAGADVHAKTFPYEKYQIWMGVRWCLQQTLHAFSSRVTAVLKQTSVSLAYCVVMQQVGRSSYVWS